jgi:hypothetical protein
MSLAEILDEVPRLPAKDRHLLAATLARLEIESDPSHFEETRRRADDTDPENWISLTELKASK